VAIGEAERLADSVAGADPELDALAERLRAVRLEAEDLGVELRRYAGGLEAEPGRLEEVESRLEQYDRLRRKHGGSVEAVLGHADYCRAELARLERAEEDTTRLEDELERAGADERDLAGELTRSRADAAPRLATRVREELDQLAMEGAEFAVELTPRDELGPAGAERVELLVAPNPGVPPMPLRETASGGETSRLMLALLTAAGAAGDTTLVFDEVDAGIGGQTARAVGERLRALAEQRQIVCITHLPQIASLARRHFRIEKSAESELARTTVEALEDSDVVAELCRMLGADTSDAGARRHAEELLAAA
jgi:DNA repair protein RecN (Recombination protein N)